MALANITFTQDGTGHCLYTEAIDLASIGPLQVQRASEVEFHHNTQHWQVRLPGSPEVLFASPSRAECLVWEREHLTPNPK